MWPALQGAFVCRGKEQHGWKDLIAMQSTGWGTEPPPGSSSGSATQQSRSLAQ